VESVGDNAFHLCNDLFHCGDELVRSPKSTTSNLEFFERFRDKRRRMDSIKLLIYNLLIFSFVPSFCEEVFFRGTMQPLWVKSTGSKWLAVLVTATIFSFLHFQFFGFLPRLFGGLVLGTIFLFSKNITLTVICHVIYNGSIVVLNYAEQHRTFETSIFQRQLLNPYLILAALVLTTGLLLQLHKTTLKVEGVD
jgi:membrane protease YdiL (CAAX protease family)